MLGEERGHKWVVVRNFGFCCFCQNKGACVELCQVKMARQVGSIRCGYTWVIRHISVSLLWVHIEVFLGKEYPQ